MPITATNTARGLVQSARGPAGRIDAARKLLLHVGWPERSVFAVPGQLKAGVKLLQLATAGEPRALIVASGDAGDGAMPAALAYSREAPYTVRWHGEGVELLETTRWGRYPGDSALLSAERGDLATAEDIFSVLSPDAVAHDRPAALGRSGDRHPELHERLAQALADLRLRVAQSGSYEGLEPHARDSALLRFFHQLLYIRFQEDRGAAASAVRLTGLLEREDPRAPLLSALRDYRERLNSELFAEPELSVAALDPGGLREVIRALVEPWDRLRLNFSVSRAEIAGRLYQSYLDRIPALREDRRRPRQLALVPRVAAVDERERKASYYTPPALARQLARQTLGPWLERRQPKTLAEATVLDPACGSGAFLIAAYRQLLQHFERQAGRALGPARREQILRECIYGADIDERALGLAQVQLLEEARLGDRRLPELGGNLFLGDSLVAPPGLDAPSGAVPWQEVRDRVGRFSAVLANPPFGSQLTLPRRLSAIEREEARRRFPGIRAWGSDYAYLFLALALELVDEEGAVGFVLPRTFLDGTSAAMLRTDLVQRGPSAIVDLRGLQLFTGIRAYVALLTLGGTPRPSLTDVADSRADAGQVLDELLDDSEGGGLVRRSSVPRAALAAEAERGWSAFRLRWFTRLRRGIGVESEPLSSRDGRGARTVVQGTQPGDLRRYVISEGDWQERGQKGVVVDGHAIPSRYAPRYVRGEQIAPFAIHDSGARLLVPFDDDRSPVADREVAAVLAGRGGAARHAQPGDLATLRAPKVILRAFGRESAAVADTTGEWMTIKGTGGGVVISWPEASTRELEGLAALLNSALYQWLLHGFGRPRFDETVELTVGDVTDLPWPALGDDAWSALAGAGAAVIASLDRTDPAERIAGYWETRRSLDDLAFDLLAVSESLRSAVSDELVRAG
jgi:hypothetical protein